MVTIVLELLIENLTDGGQDEPVSCQGTVPALDDDVMRTLVRSPATRERPKDALTRNYGGEIHDLLPGLLAGENVQLVAGVAQFDVSQQPGGGALLDRQDRLALPALSLGLTELGEPPPGRAGVQSHSEKLISPQLEN